MIFFVKFKNNTNFIFLSQNNYNEYKKYKIFVFLL